MKLRALALAATLGLPGVALMASPADAAKARPAPRSDSRPVVNLRTGQPKVRLLSCPSGMIRARGVCVVNGHGPYRF